MMLKGETFIEAARSLGAGHGHILFRHLIPNALAPVLTILALSFGGLFSGAVITETVFGWQGMGALFKAGLDTVDPAPVMAFFLVTGTAAVLMNLVADIAYAFLDPRIAR